MMRGHRVLAEPLAQMSRHALRHTPGVHEDQRGAMLFDELGQSGEVLLPDLVRHHRVQWRPGHFHAEIHRAAMTLVDD